MIKLNDYLYSGDTVLKILQRYTEDLKQSAKETHNQIDFVHCNFLFQISELLQHNDFLTSQSQRIREFYKLMANEYPFLAFTFKGRIKSLIRAESKFNGYIVEYISDYYNEHGHYPYYHGSRVASHPRLMIAQREPVIQPEHMPQNHQKYLSRNEDEFRSWASTIGPRTIEVVNHFLTSGSEPEQGYKSCSSLTKLANRYGHDRLEKACERVLCYISDPAIRNISTILKNGQDKVSVSTVEASSNGGGITRGPGYYRRGGAHND